MVEPIQAKNGTFVVIDLRNWPNLGGATGEPAAPRLIAELPPETLTELSSGIPRELIALSRYATLEARKMGHPNITLEAVERAARRKRMDYEVLLTSKQLNLLRKIHETKNIENDEAHRALLHNLSALEYRNSRVWYDVHPLVEPLLPEAS